MKPTRANPYRLASVLPLMAAILPLFAELAAAAPAVPEFVQILVKPKASMNEATLTSLLTVRGAKQKGTVSALNVRIIRVPAVAAAQLLTALQHHNDVEYAEPDFTAEALGTANDPYFTQGSEWHLSKIQAPAAWDITTGSPGVTVAIVDSGVRASHPDLAGKVLAGYDFVANDSDPTDENGHGTAAAGVVSPATNNQIGVAGVSWNTPILPVRVLDANGSGSYSAIANGITYAADRGAKVINLSLGGTTSSRTLQDAVNYAWNKQSVIVAAAGNNGNSTTFYPAACTNVVAVSATDAADVRPSWSNFGSYVDVSAPGANILSLYGADQYASWNGTSFSCPVASGVVALAASANSKLTNAQLVDLLIKNTDDIGAPGYDVYYGSGRVNAYRTAAAALALVSNDVTAPVVGITSPADGATLAPTTQRITVSGSDNVAVTKIELYIDGKLFGTSTTSTATFSWSTKRVIKGSHTLQAYAYDAAANVGASSTVTVWK
ncbi:S8 family serine peptidase [bacterium]|nr:S8 family serine peptidase [bacterium]